MVMISCRRCIHCKSKTSVCVTSPVHEIGRSVGRSVGQPVSLNWLSPRVSESVYDLHSISSFSLSLFADFLRCHQTAWRYRLRRAARTTEGQRRKRRRRRTTTTTECLPSRRDCECPKSMETQPRLLGWSQSTNLPTRLATA